jgi:PKD repeat protein
LLPRLFIAAAILSSSILAAAQPELKPLDPQRTIDAHAPAAPDASRIHFQAGSFDPLTERIDAAAMNIPQAAGAREYLLVQFHPGMTEAKSELETLGVRFFGYVPSNAFQARVPRAMRTEVASHPAVRWVGDYDGIFKLQRRLWPGSDELSHQVTIVLFPDASMHELETRLRAEFPSVLRTQLMKDPDAPTANFAVPLSIRDRFVSFAANLDPVAWIEPFDEIGMHNASSAGPLQGNAPGIEAHRIFARGITGSGQIIAVADSGLDTDMCFFRNLNGHDAVTEYDRTVAPVIGLLHPERKVIGYWVQQGADPYDTNAACSETPTGFHGTHVAGTAAGDDFKNISSRTSPGLDQGDGMAPNAQILFQDVVGASGCFSGLGNRTGTYQQARDGGARVHTNSYGANSRGAYTSGDFLTDRFLFDNDEMVMLFSAGNSGPAATTGGSPGNSKNVITVGAVGSGNSVFVTGFSSRGPAADGRIKPDLVGPGSGISSAMGDATFGNGNCFTIQKSGTSMATPAVAGVAALLRQYFADGFYPTGAVNSSDARNIGAALVKAVLLNGTRTLPENGVFGDFAYGWGRPHLDSNLYFTGDDRRLRVWNPPNGSGLKTGESHTYSVRVEAGEEFRATLVWSDPEATLGAATTLVNNLDLTVHDGSDTFRGNVFSTSGQSITEGSPDQINNVEQVRFTVPRAGIYTITVRGANVPGNGRRGTDRQGYALVSSQAACASAVTAPPTNVTAVSSPTMGVTLSWTLPQGATAVQIYRASGTCAIASADFQFVGTSTGTTFTDTRAQGGFTYSYRLRAVDPCGEGPISSCMTIVPTGSCDLQPTFDGIESANEQGENCQIDLSWGNALSLCPLGTTIRYNIYRSTNPAFVPTGAPLATVAGTSFSDTTVGPGQTYYYIVRAEDSVNGGSGPNGGNEDPNLRRLFATPSGPPGAPSTWRDDGGDTNALLIAESPWTVTTRDSQAGGHSYVSATGNGPHPHDTCASLTTPALVLSDAAELTYWARYNLEFEWDGVIVEISSDNGTSWQPLPPAGGYGATLRQTLNPPVNACGYPSTTAAFTGPASQVMTPWREYSSSLAAYAGHTVRIRWRLTTDPGVAFEGFFLDTITVTNVRLPEACLSVDAIPGFSWTPRAPIAGTALSFLDESTNATGWLWSFGDGNSSTQRNPQHTYTAPGRYVVTLTVTNQGGSKTLTREVTVTDAATNFVPRMIVPGQARAEGAAGAFFRSAVWMTNPSATESLVRLRFVPAPGGSLAGAEDLATLSIPSGRSATFGDVLTEAFGANGNTTGVIVVEVADISPAPIVTARTFNDTGARGTLGQYIQGIPLGIQSATTAVIEGLSGNEASRSNVGVVNLGTAAIDAVVSVFGADGVKRGNDVFVQVPAHSAIQVNGINNAAAAGPLDLFSVSITANGSFFAYSSKLDNRTSDPIFVPSTLQPRAEQWIDGVGAVTGAGGTFFRSNLVISNRNDVPAEVTIALTPRGGTAPSHSANLIIPAGQTRFYGDAVAELYGIQGAGSLRLTTSTATPVVAWGRTYSDLGVAGTLGQFIPAFSTDDLIPLAGAILQGLSQNARYRTNMGLVNASPAAAAVTIAVHDGDGSMRGERTVIIAGGQSLFLGGIMSEITGGEVTDGYLVLKPSAAGAIYGWASFVDNLSTDQTFVRPIALGF